MSELIFHRALRNIQTLGYLFIRKLIPPTQRKYFTGGFTNSVQYKNFDASVLRVSRFFLSCDKKLPFFACYRI